MAGLSNCLDQLRKWRENNERKSREIVDLWFNVLLFNLQKLGKERPLILEQVVIASLDCHQMGVAHKCIEELYKDFPNSMRVKKYEVMFLEAEDKLDEALKILDSIIKQDETNSAAKKRRIAILKAQNKNVEAIKELADYLKVFMADVEAWQELSELYILENDLNKAVFCVEELILHNPHNHLLHQRYADIKYTQGGPENMEMAKAYYCQAFKLNPRNIRALYGLYLTSTAVSLSSKSSAQKKKEAVKMTEWALMEIRNLYESTKASSDDNNLEQALGALQIS